MADNSNDNDAPRAFGSAMEPDAHGQAAMFLIESLIHALVARSVLSVEEAVEVVEIAAEVKAEIAADLGDSPATMRKSLTLLAAIGASLNQDVRNR